jgi:hypothetical protein
MKRKREAHSLMASYKIVKGEKINLTITVPYTFKKFRVCITEGKDFKKLVSHIEKGKMIWKAKPARCAGLQLTGNAALMSQPIKWRTKMSTTTNKLTNVDFGIRSNGDRAKVLNALLAAKGKPVPATTLAKLARGRTTTRVARIVRRVTAKAKVYKLPVKVVVAEDKDGARLYAITAKK